KGRARMGMEQAWVLPAIPATLFVLIALFNGLMPRRGDFLAVLGMLTVVALVFVLMADFMQAFNHGHYEPQGTHTFAFDWVNIGQGFFIIEFSTYVDAITMVMLP